MACCCDGNIKKDNHPIEQFLTDQTDLLERILTTPQALGSGIWNAHERRAASPHRRPASNQTASVPDRRSMSFMGTTAVERTQDTLLRRCAGVQRLHVSQHPAQQGDRTQAIQWPFQTEGERRPTRHTRRPGLPSTTTPTPPPVKAQPRSRPLRPPPTLRPPGYQHRRHHYRLSSPGLPLHRPGCNQSQRHPHRGRKTQCQHCPRPNHRPQSKTPHPLGCSHPSRNITTQTPIRFPQSQTPNRPQKRNVHRD